MDVAAANRRVLDAPAREESLEAFALLFEGRVQVGADPYAAFREAAEEFIVTHAPPESQDAPAPVTPALAAFETSRDTIDLEEGDACMRSTSSVEELRRSARFDTLFADDDPPLAPPPQASAPRGGRAARSLIPDAGAAPADAPANGTAAEPEADAPDVAVEAFALDADFDYDAAPLTRKQFMPFDADL